MTLYEYLNGEDVFETYQRWVEYRLSTININTLKSSLDYCDFSIGSTYIQYKLHANSTEHIIIERCEIDSIIINWLIQRKREDKLNKLI